MAIVALAFNYVQEKVIADTQSFYFYLSISLVFIALLNYFVLELLFNSYGKKQIKRISDILPENILQEEENVNFQQLGERIQKNVSEIDMMKEMEDYRKEYNILINELQEYNPELLGKERFLVISKSDFLDDELKTEISAELNDIPHLFISSVTGQGIMALKDKIWQILNK